MILDKFSLKDKVAVITGGGRGIGRGIALAFAEAGADVSVCARTTADVERVAVEVRERGRRGVAATCDVRNVEQVDEMVKKTVAELGRIDILINNAGGQFWSRLLDMSERGFNTVVQENLTSVFIVSNAVVKSMVDQGHGGGIINISTGGALRGGTGTAPYAAAKAGVINLTLTQSFEWARHDIRVNCILPGPIWTEGVAVVLFNTPERKEKAVSRITRGRFGTPEDIALACIYLSSPASDWITGQHFYINGGDKFF